MKAVALIANLQGFGYQLSLDGENLRFRYTRAGDPPERAATLLDAVRQHKAEVLDYLRLLQTPQGNLKEPLLIETAYLNDTLYLVANDVQARKVEAAGGVCYLPVEVRALLANSAGMNEKTLKDYLGKIHEVKKIFRGSRIDR